jgi:glycosyltransferase involved in cell wall biosynthesis
LARTSAAWHLITAEYPPVPGGVGDYTHLVAGGLARAGGGPVHVWTGLSRSGERSSRPTPEQPGVAVCRDAGRWSRSDLARLDAALDDTPGPRRLLVQYVPQAFGYRGMNLALPRWLARRRQTGDEVWVMFHEAYIPLRWGDRPTWWLLSVGQQFMARALLAGCARAFVSMHALVGRLRRLAPRAVPIEWVPVPSGVPVRDDPHAAATVRRELAPAGDVVIGCFGAFGASQRSLLARVLPPLLTPRGRVGLLIGRNGPQLARELEAAHPGLAGRLRATGGLEAASVSQHLLACDVMIQPYDAGVVAKRTSLMACLAHGRAVVTHLGRDSEPLWAETDGVALGPDDGPGLVEAAEALIADPASRARLGRAARQLYDRRFALEYTIAALTRATSDASGGTE